MRERLSPFWCYYGGKFRAAPFYPRPLHRTIVEPFAGAAGYSMRYADHNVILLEKYAVIAEIWRFLIRTPAHEILRIPVVDAVADLPSWVPEGARYLVGFCMNDANVSPCKTLSAGLKRLRAGGSTIKGWSEARRRRVAAQVELIRHWRIIEGEYAAAPDVCATWFIDPPYNNHAGASYVHSDLDYSTLAKWCKTRRGQVMVCENDGANWLPFQPFRTFQQSGAKGDGVKRRSVEVLYMQ